MANMTGYTRLGDIDDEPLTCSGSSFLCSRLQYSRVAYRSNIKSPLLPTEPSYSLRPPSLAGSAVTHKRRKKLQFQRSILSTALRFSLPLPSLLFSLPLIR